MCGLSFFSHVCFLFLGGVTLNTNCADAGGNTGIDTFLTLIQPLEKLSKKVFCLLA